jgi:hypothetical protein
VRVSAAGEWWRCAASMAMCRALVKDELLAGSSKAAAKRACKHLTGLVRASREEFQARKESMLRTLRKGTRGAGFDGKLFATDKARPKRPRSDDCAAESDSKRVCGSVPSDSLS